MTIYRYTFGLLLVALLVIASAWAQDETPPDPGEVTGDPVNMNLRFKRHLSGTETCLTCHGSFNIISTGGVERNESLWVDPDDFLASMHARLGCIACHTNIDEFGHRVHSDAEQEAQLNATYSPEELADIGASGLSALEEKAEGHVNREAALVACANCHIEEFEQYKLSIHGQAVIGEGNADPPYCIDCHGWHYVRTSEDPLAMTNPANIPGTCKNCHGETEIKRRYGLTKNVTETFGESFHARRGEMGAGEIAVCTSCHGWHEIYPPDDPRSKVNINRISQTCGECHQGAQINFASAFTHGEVSRTELVGIYAVTQTHKWMIVGIIAPLVFLVIVNLVKTQRAALAQRRKERMAVKLDGPNDTPVADAAVGIERRRAEDTKRTYLRFNIHQRAQHFLLASSFLGLMITGMPLRFPELAICRVFIAMLGGPETVGIIHRILGLVMASSGIYHVIYLIVMWFKGYRKNEILFVPGDFKLFVDDMKYFFGFRKKPPRFGRYNWREKFDYFGACFGVILMVLTGLVIWFPQIVTWFLPGWSVTAAVLLHEYEALLAGLAIFLSHFYWVHLNPDVYPMSMVWLTGRITEDEFKHAHPEEYEKVFGSDSEDTGEDANEAEAPVKEGLV